MDDLNSLGCWLTLTMGEQHFMVSVDHVVELTKLTGHPMAELPGSPPSVMGTMRLRDTLIPLIDLRTVLGMPSMREETQQVVGLLDAREADHVKWLNELEASVREEREFTLTTNPHACTFGQWYDDLMGSESKLDSFTNRNLSLRAVLEEFKTPHEHIHSVATVVTGLVHEGRAHDALARIDETRDTTLTSMIRLFGRARELVRQLRQPLVVVVERDRARAGLLIDEVDAIRRLEADAFDPVPGDQEHCGFVTGVCARDETEPMRMVLSISSLVERYSGVIRRAGSDSPELEAV